VRVKDVEDSVSIISELQHVLHTILSEAFYSPLVKALRNHGFTTVMDFLLMNQAERDAIHFLKVDGALSTLPTAYKNRLLAIKLFGQYCENEGKPIVNWKSQGMS